MAPRASNPIPILAIGGFTPLGATWVQTCASLRAGLTRFADHPWYETVTRDPDWDEADPLRCAAVPEWDETLDDPSRLTLLAQEALRDLLDRMPLRRVDLATGGLVIVLPPASDVPGAHDPRTGTLPQLLERTGLDGFARGEVRDGGPAAFFMALQDAWTWVRSDELAFCIVGAVDSWLLDERLDALDAAWRLRTQRNPDGFLPGEGAVMVLVAGPRFASAAKLRPLCLLGPVGLAKEPATIRGDRASTGSGLAAAIRTATAGAPQPSWVLCDLNGESYRAFEWGLVQGRLAPLFGGAGQLTHPADGIGDVGVAVGPLLVSCAAHGFARGSAPEGPALIWLAGDDGTRVAVLATGPNEKER